jgi:hypothetical protein
VAQRQISILDIKGLEHLLALGGLITGVNAELP